MTILISDTKLMQQYDCVQLHTMDQPVGFLFIYFEKKRMALHGKSRNKKKYTFNPISKH